MIPLGNLIPKMMQSRPGSGRRKYRKRRSLVLVETGFPLE